MNGSVIIGSPNYYNNHLLCSLPDIIPLRVQRGAPKTLFCEKTPHTLCQQATVPFRP